MEMTVSFINKKTKPNQNQNQNKEEKERTWERCNSGVQQRDACVDKERVSGEGEANDPVRRLVKEASCNNSKQLSPPVECYLEHHRNRPQNKGCYKESCCISCASCHWLLLLHHINVQTNTVSFLSLSLFPFPFSRRRFHMGCFLLVPSLPCNFNFNLTSLSCNLLSPIHRGYACKPLMPLTPGPIPPPDVEPIWAGGLDFGVRFQGEGFK